MPAPLDGATQPPGDRYCDLVLTGGVADGVVYPWAIVEIAREFRFKNIGGTSVGAMAAALTAAAEYSRRLGHLGGFNEVLRKLPDELARQVDRTSSSGRRSGTTRLFSLFQPIRRTERLFDLFVGLFGLGLPTSGVLRKARYALAAVAVVLRVYWIAAVCGIALVAALELAALALHAVTAFGTALLVPAATGVLVPLALGCAIYVDLTKGLVPNGFGICTGGHGDGRPANEPSLTEWLNEGIQAAARRRLDDPLTFRDLWDAPGGPPDRAGRAVNRTRKARSIDLQVISTIVTLGRPLRLPQEDDTRILYFRLEEWKAYFPQPVLAHLDRVAARATKVACEGRNSFGPQQEFLELPDAELPVVVAARLSLSFPVLFSAVPFWTADFAADGQGRCVRRCGLSDGGICSNLPIHLFDAAVPRWPTFGISLCDSTDSAHPQEVWLPGEGDEELFNGQLDNWYGFADTLSATGAPAAPIERLFGFAKGILYSAKDWDDATSLRMPGVRDRVARVFLRPGESGLNLKLSGGLIRDMASRYGTPAGRMLVERYLGSPDSGRYAPGWDEQRWARFNIFLSTLRERIGGLSQAAGPRPRARSLEDQIDAATSKRPPDGTGPPGMPPSAEQAAELRSLLDLLERLEADFERLALPQPYRPRPPPELRVRPPI